MNEVELGARLREALRQTGRTEWELSRRADVKLSLVEALLKGAGGVPIAAVCRVVDALELQLLVATSSPTPRSVGPVLTVVDEAIAHLKLPSQLVSRPPPPAGHTSWLDFAVSTMDTRSASLPYLFEDAAENWSRQDMERAVHDELSELRRRAGQLD